MSVIDVLTDILQGMECLREEAWKKEDSVAVILEEDKNVQYLRKQIKTKLKVWIKDSEFPAWKNLPLTKLAEAIEHRAAYGEWPRKKYML